MLSGALRWAAKFPPLQPRPGGARGSFPTPSGHHTSISSCGLVQLQASSLRNSPNRAKPQREEYTNRKQKGAGIGGRGVFSSIGTVTRGWGPAPLVSHCTYSPLGWLPKEKRTYAVVGLMGQRGAFEKGFGFAENSTAQPAREAAVRWDSVPQQTCCGVWGFLFESYLLNGGI